MKTSRPGAAAGGGGRQERAGIYVHVPFCRRKCVYCDFASYAGCPAEETGKYFEALSREISLLKRSEEAAAYLPADSLFIGGGTPSSVDPHYIADIVEAMPLTEDAEVTMEANPGTVDADSLAFYREAGINRLSIGVQSFDDSELAFLGRIHSSGEAVRAFEDARSAGFDNISMDLMFGFPGQTMDSWKRTLDRALTLEPEHISFYSLQIEEGTPLYEMFRRDAVDQLPDELNRQMYHYAVKVLRENGLERYEISNAARVGRRCRHNLKYWTMQPYLGLGAAAHSFVGGVRYARPETVAEYEKFVGELERSGSYFSRDVNDFYVNTPDDSMSDCMFTGLRLPEGISVEKFEDTFHINFMENYGQAVKKHISDGTLTFDNGKISFTEKGIDISNSVLIDFI